jgi:adenylate kinase
MLVVLVGPPGAGKGTQSQRLAEYLRIPHCSTGDMFRDACQRKTKLGLQAIEYMQSGRLVPDSLVEELVMERLSQDDCRSGCVLDGFPRTVPQAKHFDLWASQNYLPVSIVVAIEVDEQTLLDRLADRGRQDDDRQVVHERFRQYEELTVPLLDYYRGEGILSMVDGVGGLDEVYERIQQAIEATRS